MRSLPAMFATTHVDSHGEVLTKEELEQMVHHITETFIPVGEEHDPRIPPYGRIVEARLEILPDGFIGVKGRIELFEDTRPSRVDGRCTFLRFQEDHTTCVIDDRAFGSPPDQAGIAAICSVLGASAHTERKKSVETIATLTIAFALAGGVSFIDGFFGKAGEDAWDAVKPHLKNLFGTSRKAPAQLLVLEYSVEIGGLQRRVDIILSDPTDSDIDALTPGNLRPAETETVNAITSFPELHRLVFSFTSARGPVLEFGVEASGYPLLFAAPRRPFPQHTGLSFGWRSA